MTESWGTCGLSPTKKSVFNLKIVDLPGLMKIYGHGFHSPGFDVVGSDGKTHTVRLRFTPYCSGQPVEVDGVAKPGDEYVMICIDVVDFPSQLLLAGNIEMEFEGKTIVGCFGNAEKFEFVSTGPGNYIRFLNKSSAVKNLYVKGNGSSFCVDIKAVLDVKVQLSTPGTLTTSTSLVEVRESKLLTDIKSLLTNADTYADFSIVCQGQNFPCHEAILRARSPVLDKMFLQKMKEWKSREIIMEDVKKETVSHFLEFIYTGEVTKKVKNDDELIYVADKYNIVGLLDLCLRKLPEVEESKVVDMLVLADRHNLQDSTKVLMQRVLKDKTKFLKDEDFVAKLKETPHLLMDLFQL